MNPSKEADRRPTLSPNASRSSSVHSLSSSTKPTLLQNHPSLCLVWESIDDEDDVSDVLSRSHENEMFENRQQPKLSRARFVFRTSPRDHFASLWSLGLWPLFLAFIWRWEQQFQLSDLVMISKLKMHRYIMPHHFHQQGKPRSGNQMSTGFPRWCHCLHTVERRRREIVCANSTWFEMQARESSELER